MKKKLTGYLLAGLMMASLTACGNGQTQDTAENNATLEDQTKESPADGDLDQTDTILGTVTDTTESTTEGTESVTYTDFAFLSHNDFSFSSGAGGWSTDFEIEQDGSFSGTYHDSELGSTGDDYPGGTMYLCSFSGKFTNLRKINEYTYEMDMEDLTYENTPGEEEIADNMKYIYDEAYGLAGCDTFKVYLPGTPVRDLTDEEYQWVRWANEGDGEDAETLAIQVIVNEKEEFAMYSYMAYPQDESFYERAWDYLDTYGQTYETLKKELEENSMSQGEMNETAHDIYLNNDECLNYIWDLIRQKTDGTKFQEILSEQRQWIADKEEAGQKIGEEYNGSMSSMQSDLKMAELTMERCKELAEYLKDE